MRALNVYKHKDKLDLMAGTVTETYRQASATNTTHTASYIRQSKETATVQPSSSGLTLKLLKIKSDEKNKLAARPRRIDTAMGIYKSSQLPKPSPRPRLVARAGRARPSAAERQSRRHARERDGVCALASRCACLSAAVRAGVPVGPAPLPRRDVCVAAPRQPPRTI